MDLDPITKALNEIDLKEFDAGKREQDRRTDRRDNYTYVTLLVISSAVYASQQARGLWPALLLPFACFALGWKALSNDGKVVHLGQYAEHLGERIRRRLQLDPACPPEREIDRLFHWEQFRNQDGGAATRQRMHLLTDLVLYAAPGLVVALIAAATLAGGVTPYSTAQAAVAMLGLAFTLQLNWLIVGDYARQRRAQREDRP